ncbi:MAG: Obg family GTPase CgtA [Desulfovibrio sp.]|nr:MAG: Obg family GTPase CgtA [Desulfovibrio sp.]
MRFVDEASITVRSGNGGHGCVSFRREKFIPKGGPDGGDGGRGGDVILRAEPRLVTLQDFRLKRRYSAENGRPGQGRQKYGRAGKDLIIEVPLGTLVYMTVPEEAEEDEGAAASTNRTMDEAALAEAYGIAPEHEAGPKLLGGSMVYEMPDNEDFSEPDPQEGAQDSAENDEENEVLGNKTARAALRRYQPGPREDETLLVDLAEPGQEQVVVKGGRGGKGNTHFKSSTMRAPRFAQPGETGREVRLRLELKVLADAGLVGLPNAGKSTLITALSAARPKVAPYPFTTLSPNLGVMEREPDDRMIIADIPGLIEGAHMGLGLGHRFLKHVERTRFLVHWLGLEEIDQDWETSGNDPFAGFGLINDELAKFDPQLAERPQLKVVNKIDLWERDKVKKLAAHAKERGERVYFISALEKDGTEQLSKLMWREWERLGT